LSQCVFVARESDPAEGRVAGSVETVKKMKALGLDVLVEAGAGLASRILDADYEAAGARIVGPEEAKAADVVLKVRRPTTAEISTYKPGAIVSPPWIPTATRPPSPRWRRPGSPPSPWS
jgi:NAD(P) transhydrogenase subunit alpha